MLRNSWILPAFLLCSSLPPTFAQDTSPAVVETMIEVQPGNLTHILIASPAFLNSVDAKLVSRRRKNAGNVYQVSTEHKGPNLMSIRVEGPDKSEAVRLAQALLESAGKKNDGEIGTVTEEIRRLEAALEENQAKDRLLSAQERDLRKKARNLDPSDWGDILRKRLAKLSENQFDVRLEVSVQRSLRELLKKELAETPRTKEVTFLRPNPEWTKLGERIKKLRHQLIEASNRNHANDVARLSKEIDRVEQALEQVPQMVNKTSQAPDPHHGQILERLIQAEFEIAENEARLRALTEMMDLVLQEIDAYGGLEDASQKLREERLALQNERTNLRGTLQSNNQKLHRAKRAPFKVIIAPQLLRNQ